MFYSPPESCPLRRALPLLPVLLSRAVGLSVSQDGAEADQAATTHPRMRRYQTGAGPAQHVLGRLGGSNASTGYAAGFWSAFLCPKPRFQSVKKNKKQPFCKLAFARWY